MRRSQPGDTDYRQIARNTLTSLLKSIEKQDFEAFVDSRQQLSYVIVSAPLYPDTKEEDIEGLRIIDEALSQIDNKDKLKSNQDFLTELIGGIDQSIRQRQEQASLAATRLAGAPQPSSAGGQQALERSRFAVERQAPQPSLERSRFAVERQAPQPSSAPNAARPMMEKSQKDSIILSRNRNNEMLEVKFPNKQMRDKFIELIGSYPLTPEQKEILLGDHPFLTLEQKESMLRKHRSPLVVPDEDDVLYFPAKILDSPLVSTLSVCFANPNQQKTFFKILCEPNAPIDVIALRNLPIIEFSNPALTAPPSYAREQNIRLPIPVELAPQVVKPAEFRFFERSVADRKTIRPYDWEHSFASTLTYIREFKIRPETTIEECTDYMKAMMKYRSEITNYDMATIQAAARRSPEAASDFFNSRFCQPHCTPDPNIVLDIYLTHVGTQESATMLQNLIRLRPEIKESLEMLGIDAAIQEEPQLKEKGKRKFEEKEEKKPLVDEKEEKEPEPEPLIDEDDVSCPITYDIIDEPVKIDEEIKDKDGIVISRKTHYFEKTALEEYFKDVEKKFNAAEDKKLGKNPQYQKQQWEGIALNPRTKQPITRAMVKDGKELLPLIEKYKQQQEALEAQKAAKPPGKKL